MTLQDLKENLSKFSWPQACSNSDGKTSMSGTMGGYLCIVGGISFLIGVLDFAIGTKKPDIMIYSSIVIGTGAGLLGYRKSKQDGSITDEAKTITELHT